MPYYFSCLVWYSLGVLLFIRTGCLFVLLLLCLFHVVVVIMTSLACVVFHGRLVVEQVLGSLGLVVQGPCHCWPWESCFVFAVCASWEYMLRCTV